MFELLHIVFTKRNGYVEYRTNKGGMGSEPTTHFNRTPDETIDCIINALTQNKILSYTMEVLE